MNTRLPPIAVVLGLAGLIPFIACGLAVVGTPDPQSSRALAALIGYGAVILAFLGAVHWGLVLAPRPQAAARQPRESLRLVLGVVPSLIGWAALLTAELLMPDAGLAILVLGFIATGVAEWQMRRLEAVATGYLWLRWILSLVVLITLITVMTLHLLGAKIIL